MLYSTIEEAWNRPRFVVEGFDVQGCECDDIIARLLKCPDCLDRVIKTHAKPLIDFSKIDLISVLKNTLVGIAVILIIAIIYSV